MELPVLHFSGLHSSHRKELNSVSASSNLIDMRRDSTIPEEKKRHILFSHAFQLPSRKGTKFIPESLLVKFSEHFGAGNIPFYVPRGFFSALTIPSTILKSSHQSGYIRWFTTVRLLQTYRQKKAGTCIPRTKQTFCNQHRLLEGWLLYNVNIWQCD